MKTSYYRFFSIFFIFLGFFLGVFVYPTFLNQKINYINQKMNWKISYFPERPFRFGLDLQGGTQLTYQADLSEVPEGEKRQRMESLRSLIEHRVDQFGVAEPIVQIKGDRLVVELAGIIDPIRAMELIGETPFLEFKEIYREDPVIDQVNNAQNQAQEILNRLKQGEDFATLAKTYSQDPGSAVQGGDLGYFERGMMVPEFDEAVFSLQKNEISELIKTSFGYHIIKKTGDENDQGQIRASHILILDQSNQSGGAVWKRTELGGQHLRSASYVAEPMTGRIQINLEFTQEGARIFEEITARNIGQPLAIFLDGRSIIDTTGDDQITEEDLYAPVIQNKITGGSAVITGDTSFEKAREIVNRLRSGALPVPIEIMSSQNVGPALGIDSLHSSLFAGIWGFLAVAVFMIVFYRLPGFLAVLSLFFYVTLVLAIFKIVPVTLTLSGIAGFILSIGMAIDANILIFSRMREGIKTNKSIKDSIDDGFNNAWSSIRDGNITTLIVAFILFFIGTSFVTGFAFALIIGILISMFSSMVVSKYFLKSFENTKIAEKKFLWN